MPPDADDPYTILGVARDATAESIRSTYRRLAKQHHPDLNPGNAGAEARFKAIASANDILSDPEKRARYDRGEIDAGGREQQPRPTWRDQADSPSGHRYGPAPDGWEGEDLNDMFSSIFSRNARPNAGRRGQDEHYSLTVSFLDAVNGTTSRLTLPDGRTLDVKIPVGTEDGTVLRLRGKGAAGREGGPDGDALIDIHVAPHAFFTRDRADIRLVLPVSLSEAVLGGPVEIPTPGGPVRMRIPPHSDSGTILRLRGRGVPGRVGAPAGDLHATLRVTIGPPDAALDAFLATWQPADPANPRAAMEASR
jgi:DnaJ-class molecular chaperone